jgi:hypothetical protein
MIRKGMSKCSSLTGNKSFPIGLGFTPTQDLYDGIKGGFSIDFNWATRQEPPIFSNQAKALLNEGKSTARFQGMEYSLVSAQLTNATHNSWILSTEANQANKLDIICIFKSQLLDTEYPYIFVVIPIISMDSAVPESNYLLGLSGLSSDRRMYSLEDTLPTGDGRVFASYSTCLEPNGENALVLVFLNGRYASLRTTNAITEISGRGPTTPFPPLSVPTSITLTAPSELDQARFEKTVRVSTLLSRQVRGAQFRADDTYAYKCVVMDPDRDIKDGKLVIDTQTGSPIPLNEVLLARDKVREFEIPVSGLKPGQLETAVAIFLGILLGLLFIVALVYLFLRWRNPIGETVFPEWFAQMSGVTITACLFSFIGFLIGAFISR